jgi:hypothetical protein
MFDPTSPLSDQNYIFEWTILTSIKSRNGVQKRGPLPWVGVQHISNYRLILTPW